ncbi:menaquinone biosynthesis protein [bacterium]|nr:menaquinone biosynthesis protein [bacterium]
MESQAGALRVGEISYTNCFNIFHCLRRGLPAPGVEFHAAAPAVLNHLLSHGGIDLSISSSVEYARHADDYFLLPRYCIGATGPIWSIRLFSRVPIDELDGREVVLTGESETTVVLLKIILSKFYGFRNTFRTELTDLEPALERAPAVLLIGDKALAAGMRAPAGVHIYELSEIWLAHTGLPFVFALWTLRREALSAKAAPLAMFWRELRRSHEELKHPDEALVAAILAARPFLDRATVLRYWQLISYELTEAHLQGLREFYRLAHALGEAPEPPELRFCEPDRLAGGL